MYTVDYLKDIITPYITTTTPSLLHLLITCYCMLHTTARTYTLLVSAVEYLLLLDYCYVLEGLPGLCQLSTCN